jgi:DNA-binding CsgD family transcriptional regulator
VPRQAPLARKVDGRATGVDHVDSVDLRPLSPAAVALVEVAAMFDGSFSIDDAAAVLDEPVGALLPAVHEVLDCQVIVPRGQTLEFRHATVRAAVYAAIPEPLRGALHRRIGAVLLDRGGCDAAAGIHLVEGARPGERSALAQLDDVVAELSARSPAAASELALHVLELTEATDELRFPRAVVAVDALVASRRIDEAVRLACGMLTLPRRPARPAARLRLTLCAVQLMRGEPEPAVAEATALLAEGDLPEKQCDAAELIRLFGLLAAGDHRSAEAAADAVLAGKERPGTDAALAAGLSTLAWLAWSRGHLSIALGLVRAAVLRATRGEPRGQHIGLWLGVMLTALGEFDEAAEVLDRAAEEIELTADTLWEPVAPLLRARMHLAAGQLDEAAAGARTVLALATELGNRLVVPLALATLAQVAMLRGDLQEATDHLDHLDQTGAGPALLPTDAASLTWTRAQLTAARDGAAAAMRVVTGWCPSLQTDPTLLLQEPAAGGLTRVALAAGDRELAQAVVTRSEQLALSNAGLRSVRAAADHARGLLERNAALLSGAAADYRHPWSAASAHEDAGALLADGGQRKEARSQCELALAGYERAGAARDAARLRSRLRELGVRTAHWIRVERPVSGWDSLTDCERRVAGAVAEGLTNRQAAERLFLSRHTVDFHLRQIFLKLNIRSRVELTRVVLQHD